MLKSSNFTKLCRMKSHGGGKEGAVQYPENTMTVCFHVLVNVAIDSILKQAIIACSCLLSNICKVQYPEMDYDRLFPTPHIHTFHGHFISSDTNKPVQLMLNNVKSN